ncbi:hypothetical protein [Rhizobium leguminosarum]|uniref:Uncharacterized protein n=1 Tax=Rhizobium leguminosarum TaxID=384 RepID=A0A4Q8XR68_RHILE|nr:hypothetical protein [Rhizobium leguminosarum]TAU73100.1 hypothetical protein ELI40_28840 [Rhizobium leguminosarum]TAV81645.1 hypothetical protein ELI22_33495 [Rhizobium leguminosarum]TAV82206.1 hypothetical protein ELI21_33230 [Rhizobium leguminosarum]TAW25932.1 hypothetical protein ELI23_31840 [Rhizobium leguminosarum]TAX02921.1 hypothetical protein ELI07_32140 [Rhizobium leguminosarum]
MAVLALVSLSIVLGFIVFALRNYAPVITARYHIERRNGHSVLRKSGAVAVQIEAVSDVRRK